MRKMKRAAVAAMCGAMLFGGGCLGFGGFGGGNFFSRVLFDAAEYAAFEFVFDQDSVFDLFEDGEPTATGG